MKVEDTNANATQCLCPGCPTYNECMTGKGLRLFCSRGATDCDPTPNGCICGECPVWNEFDLGSHYFCTDGAAK